MSLSQFSRDYQDTMNQSVSGMNRAFGIRQAGDYDTFGRGGVLSTDPRNRERLRAYLLWMQQQKAQQQKNNPAFSPTRAGAQPAPQFVSPMADAIGDQQNFVDDQGTAGQPKHYLARRGLIGRLRAGDKVTVGEEGPETLVAKNAARLAVLPNSQYQSGVGELSPEADTRARVLAYKDVNDRAAGRAGRANERNRRAGMRTTLSENQLSGAPLLEGDEAALDSFQKGERPAYEYLGRNTDPATRREVMARAGRGENPYQDRLRAEATAASQARLNARDPETGMTAEETLQASQGKGVYRNRTERDAYIAEKRGVKVEDVVAERKAKQSKREEVREMLTQRARDRRDAVERFGTDRPIAVGALKREREQRKDALGLAYAQIDASGQRGGMSEKDIETSALRHEASLRRDGLLSDEEVAASGQAYRDALRQRNTRAGRAGEEASQESPAGGIIDPSIWQQTLDAPSSSASIAGLWRGLWGQQSDTEQEFEGKIVSFESMIDDLEKQPLTEAQKRTIAQNILAMMPPGWLSEYAGIFGPRKRALHDRLKKMAAKSAAAAPPAPPVRGGPARAGAQPSRRDQVRAGERTGGPYSSQ